MGILGRLQNTVAMFLMIKASVLLPFVPGITNLLNITLVQRIGSVSELEWTTVACFLVCPDRYSAQVLRDPVTGNIVF